MTPPRVAAARRSNRPHLRIRGAALALVALLGGCSNHGPAPEDPSGEPTARAADGASATPPAEVSAEPPVAVAPAKVEPSAETVDEAAWMPLDLSAARHLEGHCYILTLPEGVPPGDTPEAPQTSRLVLQESGQDLGPAHSGHRAIMDEGAGRYSHWGQSLRFSASDNSDPLSNGRVYRFRLD